MAYGVEVYDALGNLSLTTNSTMRLVEIVTVSNVSGQTYTVDLTGVEFSGDAFMYFVASGSTTPAGGLFQPTFSTTATTATITGNGVAGTAYVGVS